MSLKNYVLNGPSIVIEDDGRDPQVSWRNHLARTSGLRGGIDLVALTPQPVYAPTDGIMDWRKNDGTAGNSCRFWHKENAGWSDVFSHLSSYVGEDMQAFKQGELIAHTGATGGVTPHLHRHLLNPSGVRCNPWDFFSATSTTAPSASNGLTPIEVDPDMAFDDNAVKLLMDTAENARATREFLARLTTGIGGLPTGDAPQTLLAEAAMHRALKEPYRLLAVMFQGAAPDKSSAVEVAFAAKWGKLLAAAEAGGFNAGEVAQLRGLTLTLTGTAEPTK